MLKRRMLNNKEVIHICCRPASDTPLADAEYLAAMRAVVLPLIKAFRWCRHLVILNNTNGSQPKKPSRPSLILVSAGFDAAPGHPPTLGGYNVSPACFGSLTSSLLSQVSFFSMPLFFSVIQVCTL